MIINKKVNIYSFQVLLRYFFFISSLISTIIVLLSDANLDIKFAFLLFAFLISILITIQNYNKNFFSIPYNFYTILFLIYPLAYLIYNDDYVIGILSNDFILSNGLIDLPFDDAMIRSNLHKFIYKLIIFWSAIWISIYLISFKIKTNNQENSYNPFKKINFNFILLIAILGIFISMIVRSSYLEQLALENNPGMNLFRFLFSDPAIVIYSTIVYIFQKNDNSQNYSNLNFKFFLILILYLSNLYILGSKGALYIIFIWLYIKTLPVFNGNKDLKIFFPSKFLILFAIIISVSMFSTIGALRNTSYLSYDFFTTIDFLFSHFVNIFNQDYLIIIDKIFRRFITQGLEQFIVIDYVFKEYDFDYAKEFFVYMIKNFINLMLPGTIYFESYAPTSQLFGQIITKQPLYNNLSKYELIVTLNTQPFTSYGLATILFGNILSPIFIFLYFYILQSFQFLSKSAIFKAVISSIFFSSLIIYSFEAVIALGIQFLFQLYFISLLTLFLSIVFKKTKKY